MSRAKTPNRNCLSDEERQNDLKERYKAYCLAHWRAGYRGVPFVEPGSDLDTEGFGDYVMSQMDQPDISLKKVIVYTLDLKKRQIIGDLLILFKNPYDKKKNHLLLPAL